MNQLRRSHPNIAIVFAGLFASTPAGAQELGHKLLGAVGVNAGTQPEPGLNLIERLMFYSADQLRDRNGNLIPVRGLDIDATSNVLGLAFTTRLTRGPYFTAAIGAPLARVKVNADNPHVSVDASGLGDLFVQPVKLGGRFEHFDVVGSYSIYVPTGHFEPRRVSVGRGFVTHEFSLGGAVYADRERTRKLSFLASHDLNQRKRDIDITRGNTLQIQGGAGARVYGPVEVGLAGFALWQVTDNRGSELPPILRGARTRAYGLGPEVGVVIPSIRARFDVRAEWEFGVRSRQEGWIVVASASFVAWRPASATQAQVRAR